MQRQFYVAWMSEPDAALLAAVARATGVDEVRLPPTWWGCDKSGGGLPDPEPVEGPVNVEFMACSDRAMEFAVFGRGLTRISHGSKVHRGSESGKILLRQRLNP
jgi:hypothetical protein